MALIIKIQLDSIIWHKCHRLPLTLLRLVGSAAKINKWLAQNDPTGAYGKKYYGPDYDPKSNPCTILFVQMDLLLLISHISNPTRVDWTSQFLFQWLLPNFQFLNQKPP